MKYLAAEPTRYQIDISLISVQTYAGQITDDEPGKIIEYIKPLK
jgi:hypothetical protein